MVNTKQRVVVLSCWAENAFPNVCFVFMDCKKWHKETRGLNLGLVSISIYSAYGCCLQVISLPINLPVLF